MAFRKLAVVAAVLAAVACISAAPVLHSSQYEYLGLNTAPASETVMTFYVKLAEGAHDQCDSLLLDHVSNPKSSMYGKHLSFDQMKIFSDAKHFDTVRKFIAESGVPSSMVLEAPNMEFISVKGPISVLEKAFKIRFHEFKSLKNGMVARSAMEPLAAQIKDHVDFVAGWGRLPLMTPRSFGPVIQAVSPKQGGMATPQLIFTTYGITNATVATSQSSVSIFASLDQSFSPDDLVSFQNAYNLPKNKVNHVIGPNNAGACNEDPNNCIESNLDIQQITTFAQGADTTYWSIPNNGDVFLIWINALINTAKPPLVHSISYGALAPEMSSNDVYRFNTEACKLGLRGLTIMVASGDDGVANFLARNDASQCGFTPSFPATSPYVTAVGATFGPENSSPEVTCQSDKGGVITSGGGFSVWFPIPAYQKTVVQNYLQNGPNLPPKNLFHSQGRGYPDVSFLGHNFPDIIGGQTYQVSGTSASSPAFAGLVALVNGIRIANGKSPLGALNVAIYGTLANTNGVFNDITVGVNNCCAGFNNYVCCKYGFTATTGWDPVTGFGSVNFGPFSSTLANL